MILLITFIKNIQSQMRVIIMLIILGSCVMTSKSGVPPCFAVIPANYSDMIETQLDTLRSNFFELLSPCWVLFTGALLKSSLERVTIQTEEIYINSEVICLHLMIRPSISQMANPQLTGAKEGQRLFRQYHPILRHYVFPFESFVPHTHWSRPCNDCPIPDGGLIIDDRYYCEADHVNIVPWQNFNDMSEEMLIKFVTVMNNIVDHEFIRQHYRINHTDSVSFFVGHRHYIACVEQELSRHGIPLPYISAGSTIPPLLQGVKRSPVGCISTPICNEGWLDLPIYSSNLSYPLSAALPPERICEHKTLTSLHRELVRGWHLNIHFMISGNFVLFDSAASLFFFPFHNYIDKFIYKYWEDNC